MTDDEDPRLNIEEGDRIIFTDPLGGERSFSGEVTNIFSDRNGVPYSCVVHGDDGLWHAIDLALVRIAPSAGKLH